jgi:hypothetical protein
VSFNAIDEPELTRVFATSQILVRGNYYRVNCYIYSSDGRVMKLKLLTALLIGIGTASAESHPAWWRYASPEATALVGIQWENLRSSPFAGAIEDELTGEDGLGFPQLDCLKEARQILISSPALLAIVAGNFSADTLRDQATQKGLKWAPYRDVTIWVTPGKNTLSIARMSDQLALVGRVKDLRDAIDRNLMAEAETGVQAERAYSPLLARAAHYAHDDLWVVATRLPDPLADHFVPIDAQADGFEGSVSLGSGLRLGAIFSTGSENAATQMAGELKQLLSTLPPLVRGVEVNVDGTYATLSLALTEEQFIAGLRATPAPPAPVVAVKKSEPAKPAGPQVIRIYGLDDGPREIVMR